LKADDKTVFVFVIPVFVRENEEKDENPYSEKSSSGQITA
jgi:hypothetical protein